MLIRVAAGRLLNMDHVVSVVYNEAEKTTVFNLVVGQPVLVPHNWITAITNAPQTAVLDCTGVPKTG